MAEEKKKKKKEEEEEEEEAKVEPINPYEKRGGRSKSPVDIPR
jgi:hypothetical protein